MPPWPLTSLPPPLPPRTAHVYLLPIDLPGALLNRLAALLSPDEQARAARYKVEHARSALIASHAQMRQILSGYTQMYADSGHFPAQTAQNHPPTAGSGHNTGGVVSSPHSLRFETHPQGKPYLPGSPLRFNLSHTAGAALLAVTMHAEIGVDIEPASRIVDYAQMAPRFFAPSEAAALLALPPALQPAAFLRCWTRKEAYIKARGGGLAIPLASFTVTFEEGAAPLLTAPDPGWTLYALDPGPDFAAALVSQGPLDALHCWTWDAETALASSPPPAGAGTAR